MILPPTGGHHEDQQCQCGLPCTGRVHLSPLTAHPCPASLGGPWGGGGEAGVDLPSPVPPVLRLYGGGAGQRLALPLHCLPEWWRGLSAALPPRAAAHRQAAVLHGAGHRSASPPTLCLLRKGLKIKVNYPLLVDNSLM